MSIGVVVVVAGVAVWWWRLRAVRSTPATAGGGSPRVSIIVPARDEAHNLPALLASLLALDPPAVEIIVVDDHSRDGTGDVARAAGVRVVVPPPLPEGWLGKPWACAAGAREARGERLLFTDADTVHEPDALARACAVDAELVSVIPTHRAVARWEKLQGVFQLLLLVATRAPGGYTIGQFLLFRREAYERVGGHAAVRARVAEDLAFADLVRAGGGRVATLVVPGMLGVRMYPEGPGAFLRGWRRNFREGLAAAGVRGTFEVVLVIGWLLGAPLAIASAPLVGGVLTVATALEIARRQRLVGALPAWGAAGYPLLVLAFVAVSVLALVDRLRRAPVRWRGRSVSPSA